MTNKDAIYYFGCRHVCGHYWHLGTSSLYNEFPWWGEEEELLPSYPQTQGVVKFLKFKEWNVFSFWDRSVDKRPGSYSLFATKAIFSSVDFMAQARVEYPWVFDRLEFEITVTQ